MSDFASFLDSQLDHVKCQVCRFKADHPAEWETILTMMRERGTTIRAGKGYNGRGRVMPRHISAYVRGKYPEYSNTKFIVSDHFRKHEKGTEWS